MTIKNDNSKESGQKNIKFWPVYLCFVLLGALVPFSKSEFKFTSLMLSVAIAAVIGLITVKLLILILNSGNKALREENGYFASEAVSTGMLFMIPFAVLAVLAQLVLGWNAVMPFASAAITTSSATAGTEVMKKGAKGMKNILIPSLLAFMISTGWMMLVEVLT